jgi:subtilisin family serine protease
VRRALAAAVLLVCAAAPARALKVEKLKGVRADGREVEVVSEAAMVKWSSGTALSAHGAVASVGARVVKEYPQLGWSFVALPSGTPVLTGLRQLQSVPGVESVEPDYFFRANLVPSDPSVNSQYALQNVNAFAAWEYETGASNKTTIAVVDAGVESTHPEFAGKMAGLAHQFCDPTASTNDCVAEGGGTPLTACNHGTMVAGVAAAKGNNSVGIAGMNWSSQILSMRVFRTTDCLADCSDNGVNFCGTDNNGIISAMTKVMNLYTADAPGHATYGRIVINMSLGGGGACPAAVKTAMDAAVTAGIPIAVAAGNGGGAVESPANCATTTGGSGIVPVGATDALNNVTSFSSRGAELSANGLVAPGLGILSTTLNGGYATESGTSFASPYVAGLMLLMLSKKPAMTPAEVQTALRGGADNIGVSGFSAQSAVPQGNAAGAGRMDAFRSMRLAINGTLADFAGDQKAIAFPNPFRLQQTQSVSFSVPTSVAGANPEIKVYTESGQLVRTLHGLTWDGKNEGGRLVASGVYIFFVKTGAGDTKGRVAVIR